MSARYGLYGDTTRDFLTYGGRVLVHGSRAELEFLCPGTRVREVPPSVPAEQTLPIRFHPHLQHLSWPLRREEFRRG